MFMWSFGALLFAGGAGRIAFTLKIRSSASGTGASRSTSPRPMLAGAFLALEHWSYTRACLEHGHTNILILNMHLHIHIHISL